MLLLVTLAVLAVSHSTVAHGVADQFVPRQGADCGHDGDVPCRYRLHRPRQVDPGVRYPLLLWLHGARERGDDNLAQLRWLELVFETVPPERCDYYVLAPQCPPGTGDWFTALEGGGRQDMLHAALEILAREITQEPIDPDRIYVAGVSSGGTAAWEAALRCPDRFAAVAPLSSSGCDASRVGALKETPVWAFHSLRDKLPYLPAQAAVGALQGAGGSAALTLVDNAKHGIKSLLHEHDSWTAAFKHYDLMRWLLAQRRGAVLAPAPGARPWVWWNYGVLLPPLLLGWVAWSRCRDRTPRAPAEAGTVRDSRAPQGMTLIELLIVMSIIGMLVSLVIPAVQASRESARRTQCLNQARQIALAVQQYHDASQQLPPSRIRDRFLTWAVFPLPYLEQAGVVAGTDLHGTFPGQPESFRLTPIEVYLCPSRSHDDLVVRTREAPGIVGDYAAITSTFLLEGDHGEFFDGALILGDARLRDDHAGMLQRWRSRTALKDITDGASRTFLVGEASFWLSERVSIYDGNDNPGAILGDKVYPAQYEHLTTKHALNPIAESESQPGAWVGSAHPTTVVFALVDGSCRPVGKDAELEVLEAMVRRAGGEAASF
jgi:prepilin-type N-terminal cleavage/methylation domain-containing protein